MYMANMLIRWLLAVQVVTLNSYRILAIHHGCDGSSRPNATQRLALYGKISYTHSIRTSNPKLVQPLFDLGMVLTAGYNQPEARRTFRQALEHDNLCAMCYWGIAYARGPFQNKFALKPVGDPALYYGSHDAELARWSIGYAAALVGLLYHKDVSSTMDALKQQIQDKQLPTGSNVNSDNNTRPLRMMQRLPKCPEQPSAADESPPSPQPPLRPLALLNQEQYYIAAMFDRLSVGETKGEIWEIAEQRYAEDMMEVAKCFPEDADALALAAEALANLSPWDFVLNGTVAEDTPRNGTKEIIRLLQKSLERNASQPLALHLMIHVTEQLPAREAANETDYVAGLARDSAQKLLGLLPSLDHMQHMPSHTFVRTGRWDDAVKSNEDALRASVLASWACMSPLYPDHNVEMLVFAAALGAMYEKAQVYARVLRELPRFVPDSSASVATQWTAPLLVYVLFGNWTSIALEPPPHPVTNETQSLSERVRMTVEPAALGDVFDDPALSLNVRDAVPADKRSSPLQPQDYSQETGGGSGFALVVWMYAQLMAVADKVAKTPKPRAETWHYPPPSSAPATPSTANSSQLHPNEVDATAVDLTAAAEMSMDGGSAAITLHKKYVALLEDLQKQLTAVVGALPEDVPPADARGPGPGLGVLVRGNKLMANVMLQMAEARVKLEVNSSQEAAAEALSALRAAVALEDSAGYQEPPRLAQQPARQCLGWVLLNAEKWQPHWQEAAQTYLDDLKRYPSNLWSMFGLLKLKSKLNEEGLDKRPLSEKDQDLLTAIQRQLETLSQGSAQKQAADRLPSSCPAFSEVKMR